MSADVRFTEFAEHLGDVPLAQGILVALCTFILEDPTTIGSGLLVADGKMGFLTAFLGLSIGIAVGDVGLYALGRFAGNQTVAWGLTTQEKLDRVKIWFDQNLVSAVILSRFVPGMRLPTYVGAGMLRSHFIRFTIVVILASLVWTTLLLSLTVILGERILRALGPAKWIVAGAVIALIVFVHWRLARRRTAAESSVEDRVVSYFEFWPPYIFYIPVAVYYLFLAIRYRSLTLPTAANPSIYSGGMIKESKIQIMAMAPDEISQWIPTYTSYTTPNPKIDLNEMLAAAKELIREAGLKYPVVAKPDEGQRGAGVRPIRCDDDLRAYLDEFPAEGTVVLQRLVPYENEVGIMYYRFPGASEGFIPSITLKEFPYVVGDGARTLRKLILAHPRCGRVPSVYLERHRDKLDTVIERDRRFPLVFTGSHCRGTVFRDGQRLLTPMLAARIHEIASALPEFYFGRFDLRFKDLPSLQAGENFEIVEINGAGAESTHIWDPRMSLYEAYLTLFEQFRILFEIGAENRQRGYNTLGPVQFVKDVLAYRRLAAQYPSTQ